MNRSHIKRSSLVNLKKYNIVLTQSTETKHGISGHLFEMAEYFYHFTFHKNISTCILISDGTSKEDFFNALKNKYSFSKYEYEIFEKNTFFYFQPKVLIGNIIIFVDGSLRCKDADIFCSKKIFFRCSEDAYLDKTDIVLQDYDLYDPLPNSIHYKKKLLFSKFINISSSEDAAMFYCTKNTRMLSFDDLINLTNKYNFSKYIILSDVDIKAPSNVQLLKVPVNNLWEKFNTYIYTGLTNLTKIDCSSRFIAECKYYNKNVIYDVQRMDKGLAVRRNDIENNVDIELKETDEITSII